MGWAIEELAAREIITMLRDVVRRRHFSRFYVNFPEINFKGEKTR